MSVSQTFDADRADEFLERLVGVLNDAALALMISVGHRTGLFDVLGADGAATSAELAQEAGLEERYVREWLGAMTAGRIVELDADEGRYHLPPERAAWLMREATPDNLAVSAQYIAMLGAVEDDVVRCFVEGGGVPYDRYPRFHEVMAEESGQTTVSALVDAILPLVPEALERLEQGIRVADLGCGRGLALASLAARFQRSVFVGMDLSGEAIAWAQANAERHGLRNLRYQVRDLSAYDRDAAPASFDLVTTFDAVHDQADPAALLRGIRRSLAPDGAYLMQDIYGHSAHHLNLDPADVPLAPFMYAVSCMHCMTVSLAQGGAGLGAVWGVEKMEELIREAGFSTFEAKRLEHDPANVYVIARP